MAYDATFRAAQRAPFKVLPVTEDIVRAQQDIADRFLRLGVIPGRSRSPVRSGTGVPPHEPAVVTRNQREVAMKRILPWVVPVFLILLWQATSQMGLLRAQVFACPNGGRRGRVALARSGELWTHVRISTGAP